MLQLVKIIAHDSLVTYFESAKDVDTAMKNISLLKIKEKVNYVKW